MVEFKSKKEHFFFTILTILHHLAAHVELHAKWFAYDILLNLQTNCTFLELNSLQIFKEIKLLILYVLIF